MTKTTTGTSLCSPIKTVVNGELRSLRPADSPALVAPAAAPKLQQGSAITNSPAPTAGVSLYDLARELGTLPERLFPLIQAGYLRLLRDCSVHEHTLVERPPEQALHWLRGMFAPIYLRPMLELEQAAATMQVSLSELRTLALDHNIPLYLDPAFGELISVVGFHRLHRSLVRARRPMRYDRQAMMGILALIRGIDVPTAEKGYNLPYHERMEMEIRRICSLPEPERTARACAFYSAYMDAKTMTDCLEKYYTALHPTPGKEAMLDQRVTNMARRYGGEMAILDAIDRDASGAESSAPGPAPCDIPSDSSCAP